MAGPGEPRHGPQITVLPSKGVPSGTPFSRKGQAEKFLPDTIPAVSTGNTLRKSRQHTIRTALVDTRKNFSAFSGICHSHIHILYCIMSSLQ